MFRGWDMDRQLRHLVGGFGDEARRLIATEFDCPVWVLNQLNTEANKRGPGSMQHHANSQEAGNFAENLWYAHCLGNKDHETQCCQIACTKTRRSQGVSHPTILKIEGDMSRLVKAGANYVVDNHTSRIMSTSVHSMVEPDLRNGAGKAFDFRGRQ
jgi:hypothetical protein